MYAHPQSGSAATATAAPTLHVGTYRRTLLAAIIGNDLFTPAEQLRANHNAHECQDAQRLSQWTRNVLRERDRREAADLVEVEQTAQPTGNLLADLANPAYVAQHGAKQAALGFKLTVREAAVSLDSLRQAFAAQQPATLAPAPCATPGQCDELYRLACHPALTPEEKAQTLALLPTFTQGAAAACIGQLHAQTLRRTSQLGWRDGSTLLAA